MLLSADDEIRERGGRDQRDVIKGGEETNVCPERVVIVPRIARQWRSAAGAL